MTPAHIPETSQGPALDPGPGLVGLTFPQRAGPALKTTSVICFVTYLLLPGLISGRRPWRPWWALHMSGTECVLLRAGQMQRCPVLPGPVQKVMY